MSKITCYRGHIRNWEALASELNIDAKSMSREAREEAILLAAYEAWHEDMGNHLHGMFALASLVPSLSTTTSLRMENFSTAPISEIF